MQKNSVLGVLLWKLSRNFLGNRKTVKYKEIVAKLLSSLQDVDASMNAKLHLLYSNLYHFPENLGDLSDERGVDSSGS